MHFSYARALASALCFSALAVPSILRAVDGPPDSPTVAYSGPVILTSTSTVELRFSEPMIPMDKVGKVAESPVLFRPALRGEWRWLSDRSGVYVPSEMPPLATTYQMSLRRGVKTAASKEIAPWKQVVTTPPMLLRSVKNVSFVDSADAYPEPVVSLLFNVDVAAENVAAACSFVDKTGNEVKARVAVNTEKGYHQQHRTQWTQNWATLLLPWAAAYAKQPIPDQPANQVDITPTQTLPPGEAWQLVVRSGIPEAQGALHLMETVNHPIGNIRPFTVAEVRAQNYVNTGKRLVIEFSKPLDPGINSLTLGRWMNVEPLPADAKAELSGNKVEWTGEFEIGKTYQVSVTAGMPSARPQALERNVIRQVTFQPVAPRVYLEGFSEHQLASGRRTFQVRAVNLPAVRVTAKLFQPDTVPMALQTWKTYEKYVDLPEEEREPIDPDKASPLDEDEIYRRLRVEQLPGQMVFQKEYKLAADRDEMAELDIHWDEILGANRPGTVLVTVEQMGEPSAKPLDRKLKPVGSQALVQVTDLCMVWKTSELEAFLYVSSMATGKPVGSVQLQLLDKDNNVLAEGRTDEGGVARLPAQKKALWLLAQSQNDMHITRFDDERYEISLYRYRVNYNGDREGIYDERDTASHRMMIFTERGAYRPNETVHIKGIAREYLSGTARPPAGAKVEVIIEDAQNKTVLEKVVELSKNGSFDLDYVISSPTVGYYSMRAKFVKAAGAKAEETEPGEDEDGEGSSYIPMFEHGFVVQEFTPNAFEVLIAGPRSIAPGPAEMAVSGKYYMGKSLSKAQLKWTIRAEDDGFAPTGFDAFNFCNSISDWRLLNALDLTGGFSDQGEVALGADGKTSISTTIPGNLKAPQPRAARLLCEVTDLNNQTVTADHTFTVHSSDFYLGVGEMPEVVREGENLPIHMVAVTPEGKPLQEPVPVTVRLTRVDWQTNRIQSAGSGNEYRSEPVFTQVNQVTTQTIVPVEIERQWSVAPKTKAGAEVTVGKPGLYLLSATAKDVKGREVVTQTVVAVYGKGAAVWNYRNPFQIDLVTDRAQYTVGDKAVLLVKTPIQGEALVTVERENVRRSFVVHLEGNAPSIEVPLLAEDAPNVYVSVMLLRGAQQSTKKFRAPEYRVGYAELKVERPEAKLSVYITPDAPSHRPGDPASVKVEVLDFSGKVVPDAEVTLFAVDEGILSLTGYDTPDPLEYFNRERALQVATGLTLPRMMSEDPDATDFANKGYVIGSKGAAEDNVRKNFLPCAFWNATLSTDSKGLINVTFPTPDSLTRYRIMAVVQAPGERFGHSQSSFEVNKPIMLEPAPPLFANVGDRLMLRAVLHNTTRMAGKADVSLELDSTVKLAEPKRTVDLAANGSMALDFPAEFMETGDAVWTWRVVFHPEDGSADLRDSVQVQLKVTYPTPARIEVRQIVLDGKAGEEMDLLANVPADLLQGTGSVQLVLAHSQLVQLGEAVRALLHYPYGCVEQTTSSTLPWLALRDLRDLMPDVKKSDEEIALMVDRGVQRLFKMQTTSGGLSYWPGAREPMLWGSAYGGLCIAWARESGYPIPEESFESLLKYISEQMRGLNEVPSGYHLNERCLALLTLAKAGRAEPAYHEMLFKRRNDLSLESRAILAMAIAESKGSQSMIKELLDARLTDSNGYDGYWFGSVSRLKAMQLLAWCRADAKSPRIPGLVAELFGSRTNGHWFTTQGNAWSLLAMAEYSRRIEGGAKGSHAGTVTWGKGVRDFEVNPTSPTLRFNWPFRIGDGAPSLQVTKTDGAPLYAEVRMDCRPKLIEQPRQESGHAITRTYYRIDDDGKVAPLQDAQVGDRILVRLEVHIQKPARYLAIEDPLPAVFEALHPEFKTQETVGSNLARVWSMDYHELRKDRALFFRNDSGPGHYIIQYLARVRAAGSATAPSARVSEMYSPDRFGTTESQRITAKPLF